MSSRRLKRKIIALCLAVARSKKLVLVRHGLSEMNVALSRQPWGSRNFKDPNIRDAPLTAEGRRQAQRARHRVSTYDVDLIVSSPLTRALETMELAFCDHRALRVACSYAAERVYLSSDLGTPRAQLEKRWADVDFSELAHQDWWWTPKDLTAPDWRPTGHYPYPGEPDADFHDRMKRLLRWIHDRPEQAIALVCHWGVIDALTGLDFDNCEVRELDPRSFSLNSSGLVI